VLIDGSAIVAILARRPGSDELLARLDAAGGPFLATPLATVAAVRDLAGVKAGDTGLPLAGLLAQARDAVAEFGAALGLREVPITADLGRRAIERMVAGGDEPGPCLSAVCAAAYRVPVLAA